MLSNLPPELFLEKHLGQRWQPVSADPDSYGMLGEEISIRPVCKNLPGDGPSDTSPARQVQKPDSEWVAKIKISQPTANAYQSDILSDQVATDIGNKLKQLGIENPRDYTRVGVGCGVTLLFMEDRLKEVMKNETFIHATLDKPLITETGITKSADGRVAVAPRNTTQETLEYLDKATRDVAPDGTWAKKHDGSYALSGVSGQTMRNVSVALLESGIDSRLIPAGDPNSAGGDSLVQEAELRVSAHALKQALGYSTEATQR